MQIGIIGLGDIAQKAYLPVITQMNNIELKLCTRNGQTLSNIANQYRIKDAYDNIDALIASGIDAAFVHTSTESHLEVGEKLLQNGIHVYIDKPLAYNYDNSIRLAETAERFNRTLMVGFNRRFAPMVTQLKEEGSPRIVLMQKNRTYLSGAPRHFVFDDFIHVVDTLRFLLPGEAEIVHVNSEQQDGKVIQVVLHLESGGSTAIGIMNRDNGITEELLDWMGPGLKKSVRDLNETTQYSNGEVRKLKFKDWDPVLVRRGFHQIIEHFIQCVRTGAEPNPNVTDSLRTHHLCERIVAQIEQQSIG